MNSSKNLHPLRQAFQEQAPFLINNPLGEFVLGYKRAINFLHSLPEDVSFNQCVNQLVEMRDLDYIHPTTENIERSNRGLVAYANHAYPILDGLLIGKILEDNYPGKQVKILGNPRTKLFPEMEHFFIQRGEKNITETCIEHVASGNPLIIFPAGFSSYYDPKSNIVQESRWRNGALHIAGQASVPLQPFHTSGNIPWFYNLGKYYTEHGKNRSNNRALPMEPLNPLIALAKKRELHVKVGGLIKATQEITMEKLQTEVYDLGNQEFKMES